MDTVNGPEHYKQAELLLGLAAQLDRETTEVALKGRTDSDALDVSTRYSANMIAAAQVHTMLAQLAADVAMEGGVNVEWQKAISGQNEKGQQK